MNSRTGVVGNDNLTTITCGERLMPAPAAVSRMKLKFSSISLVGRSEIYAARINCHCVRRRPVYIVSMLTLRTPAPWRLEKAVQETHRAFLQSRWPAAVPTPVPAQLAAAALAPKPQSQQQDAALFMVNCNRSRYGLPPLTALPTRSSEQPQAQKIDPKTLAAQIVHFGRVARGEVPPPLPPKDPLAYQILRAGAIARNEPFPE
jgi:hypothetical protein